MYKYIHAHIHMMGTLYTPIREIPNSQIGKNQYHGVYYNGLVSPKMHVLAQHHYVEPWLNEIEFHLLHHWAHAVSLY